MSDMIWAVYRCDRIQRGQAPQNEVFVSGHRTPGEAMDEANRLKLLDRSSGYVVGAA